MAKIEKSEVVVGTGAGMIKDDATWQRCRGETSALFQYGLDGDVRGSAFASSFGMTVSVRYNPGRTSRRFVQRCFMAFDTSGIKDVPAKAELSIAYLKTEDSFGASAAADFKIQVIKADPTAGKNGASEASWDSSTEPTTDAFDHFVGSIFYTIGTWDADDTVPYTEEILVSDLSFSGNTPGGSGTINLLKLNDQARKDIAQYDEFRICIMDVKHDLGGIDPDATYQANGNTRVDDILYAEGLVHAGNAANRPMLKILQGKVKAGKSDKKLVNETTFIVQNHEVATEQRDVFVNKDTALTVDQVPFLLGHKGPLSLRGRELQGDGAQTQTNIAPPNTSQGGKKT